MNRRSLAVLAVLCAVPPAAHAEIPGGAFTELTLDRTQGAGLSNSIAIGTDGLGLISYSSGLSGSPDQGLKVAHCAKPACSATSVTPVTLDATNVMDNDIAVGADGLGLISYYDRTNGNLKVAHCVNVACTSATLATVDSAGNVGQHSSIKVGADGLGLISYADFTKFRLAVAHCSNASCTAATTTRTRTFGSDTSIAIGADGLALISYCGGCRNLSVAHQAPRGDFNTDGWPDLVWRHDGSGQNVVWLMNGVDLVSGTFTSPDALSDTRWRLVGTSDFNDDAQTDLLWRHATSGESAVWFMNGVNLVSGIFTTPSALADTSWRMAGTGDFNRDGRPDILWHHQTTGSSSSGT